MGDSLKCKELKDHQSKMCQFFGTLFLGNQRLESCVRLLIYFHSSAQCCVFQESVLPQTRLSLMVSMVSQTISVPTSLAFSAEFKTVQYPYDGNAQLWLSEVGRGSRQ